MNKTEADNICVVRVTTSFWHDKNHGLHSKKSITTLIRKSKGFGKIALKEEASIGGSEEAWASIININTVPDGIYYLKLINISYDCESGHIDCYELELEPYTEAAQ